MESNLPVPYHETFQVQDATKLQDYTTCERLYFYKYILGFRPEEPIHNLIFGQAWHKAKDVLFTNGYSTESIDKAYNAFLKHYRKTYSEETDMDFHPKSPSNAELALYQYVKEYWSDDFETLFTEIGISVPIADDRVIYGKMDSLLRDRLRGVISLESKTAGALWSWWADQWLMKLQTAIYTHFMYAYFEPNDVYGIIIDGTVFRKGNGNAKGNEHIRVPCELTISYLENWLSDMNRIWDNLQHDFQLLSIQEEGDEYMKAFPRRTESCVKYNRICQFHEICHAWNNPIQHLNQLPTGYKVEHWDPRKEDIKTHIKLGE